MEAVLKKLTEAEFIQKVQESASTLNIDHLHIEYVARALYKNKKLARLKGKKCCSEQESIQKWVTKFYKGYQGRISVRCSQMPGTLPDVAINKILESSLSQIDAAKAKEVVYAHRLAMSAENILGLLLEEYIFTKIQKFDESDDPNTLKWAMAWGMTVNKVDLCSSKGDLLQIKNRSNSENSSSKSVRDGTRIKKWFRINAADGKTNWNALCKLLHCQEGLLCETDFLDFIKSTLQSNPSALPVEQQSPYITLR